MKRAALYVRYSSDLQSAKSCEDQLALLREEAARRGWVVVREYRDDAFSGTSIFRREGLLAMLREAEARCFDIVFSEALDRISRDDADMPMIRKRLAFHDVAIWTISEGEVQIIHTALKGAMNAMFVEELGRKVWRGQLGLVTGGKSAGGISYGYALVPGEPGRLVINEEEAAIVRRIFAEYAEGGSPVDIAARLHAEGVPAPGGRRWQKGTIQGRTRALQGIVSNPLYNGERVWNRSHKKRNPETGRGVMVMKPESEWRRVPVPELRIVPADLWAQVQERATSYSGQRGGARRPKRVFSGVVRCAVCGSKMHVMTPEEYGCSNHYQRKACPNGLLMKEGELLARTAAGLRGALMAPEVRQRAIRRFHATLARRQKEAGGRRVELTREIGDLGRRITRLVDAIADGAAAPETNARLREFQTRRLALEGELTSIDRSAVIALRPDASSGWEAFVGRLADTLAGKDPAAGPAQRALRVLVQDIALTPRQRPYRPGYDVEIRGDLAALLDPAALNMDGAGIRRFQAANCYPFESAGPFAFGL